MKKQSPRRIAIFHNYMDNIGGAELVDLTLAKELNKLNYETHIYTTNINRSFIKKMGFSTENIFSIGTIPINAPFKQEFAYWKFRKLDISKKFKRKYDFYIIAGDWAMSSALHHKPNLWYVFSPTREIWDLYKFMRLTIPFYKKMIFDLWVLIRRFINKKDLKHIQKIICISENVKRRIKKYLKRDAEIIYPPTKTSDFFFSNPKNYWLSVNRLFHHKRVTLQLKAFKELPKENLIIVGSYEKAKHFKQYAEKIKKLKPKNVKIMSWISNQKLIKLYAECKGFITTSKDEDYGMNVVEAMASGKPVIAPNEGGYKETIINNKTGILIDNITPKKIIKAVDLMDKQLKQNPYKYKRVCQEQAKKFDTKIFIEKIKKEIEN